MKNFLIPLAVMTGIVAFPALLIGNLIALILGV